MVWSQVYQLLFVARHPPCTDCFSVQSGAKVVVYQPHVLILPPDPYLGWQMFHKVTLLEQGFVMHLDTMENPAQSRGTLG